MKRNRIKRLIRECFRLNQHNIRVRADIVVVCKKKPGLSNLNQDLVNREIMEFMATVSTGLPQDDSSREAGHDKIP